nr:O-antigen ligase family protein [Kofleriaceae bacterium]
VILRPHTVVRRIGWACVVAICAVTAFLTLSRGAVLALGFGTLVFAIMMIGQRYVRKSTHAQPSTDVWRTKVPIAVFATCVLVLGVLTTAQNVSNQIAHTSVTEFDSKQSKYAAWRASTNLISESPWLGIGRGALEPTLTRVNPGSSYHTFSHLENEYLQAVVEWGILGAVAVGGCLIWLLVAMLQRWHRGPLAAGAIGAIAAIAAQNIVDFSLDLPGVALPTAALVATLSGIQLKNVSIQSQKNPAEAKRPSRMHQVARASVMVLLVLSGIVMQTPMSRSVAESHALLLSPTADFATVTQAVTAHPFDYLAYARAADLLRISRDPRVSGFVRHALILHPTHSGLHLIAARLLLRSGHQDQAAVEYRLALKNSYKRRKILHEIASLMVDLDLAAQTIPTDLGQPEKITAMLEADGHSALALRWLELVLAQHPHSAAITKMMMRLAQRTGDVQAREHAARLAFQVDPNVANMVGLAELLINNSEVSEAVQILEPIATIDAKADMRVRGWRMRCNALIRLRRTDDARRCLRNLALANVLSSTELRSVTQQLADLDQNVPLPP